jgi:hypothetical protein
MSFVSVCNESYIFVVCEFSENSAVKGTRMGVKEFVSIVDTVLRFG